MIVALAGGVGGAKFSEGLALATPPKDVSVIVNTADDFDLYGLRICPDLDTVMYTLAGIQNPNTGWGIDEDSYATLGAIARYGEDTWFSLGDQDFATHILRTSWISQGMGLDEITLSLSKGLGIESTIIPMTNNPVATIIVTPEGELDFQEYFVRRRQQDTVTGVRFEGIEYAEPTEGAITAIREADLVVICPSNPIVSVGPILALEGMRSILEQSSSPVVAISPIVAGQALKGPADRMLDSLGHEASALGVARIYDGSINGFVIDCADHDIAESIQSMGMEVLVTDTIMSDHPSRQRLAEEVIEFGSTLRGTGSGQS